MRIPADAGADADVRPQPQRDLAGNELPAPWRTGEAVIVTRRPNCDACQAPTPAVYDFRTRYGYWMNGCWWHYIVNRAYAEVGVGRGQYLIEKDAAETNGADRASGLVSKDSAIRNRWWADGGDEKEVTINDANSLSSVSNPPTG